MDTETAALATPLSTEHAEQDKDRKNSESFKERYFTKKSPPRGGTATGSMRQVVLCGYLLTGYTVVAVRRRL
jgi:hypothetical protein